MGTFSVQIEVSRPYGDQMVSIEAPVDSGATYSVFPSNVLDELGVSREENRTFELADNRVVELPIGHAAIGVQEGESSRRLSSDPW